MPDNTLYYGDNLDILRRYVRDETVDLVYLDPPVSASGKRRHDARGSAWRLCNALRV